jgi:hypothetical protein
MLLMVFGVCVSLDEWFRNFLQEYLVILVNPSYCPTFIMNLLASNTALEMTHDRVRALTSGQA